MVSSLYTIVSLPVELGDAPGVQSPTAPSQWVFTMTLRIQQQDIERANLRTVSEIWLAGPKCTYDVESEVDSKCFWRGQPTVSHDMLSEGTHEQNLQRLWLVVANVDDDAEVGAAEALLRASLEKQNMEGEFYPAEQKNTTAS